MRVSYTLLHVHDLYLTRFPAAKHLRTLLSLVATNSEARKLLSDFSLIGRDLLSKGASKAAEGLAPDQERLHRGQFRIILSTLECC
jgi:hypothetical protein